MDTIKTLKGEKFQLKSATKLMEALDVRDEGIKSVWSKDMKITEMVVVSNEDEYDVLLCNTEKGGVIMITVHGGHGMFNSCLVKLYGKSLVAALIETNYYICLLYMKAKFGMSKSECLIVENLRKPSLYHSSIR